jgi:hypothetical protein
VENCDFVAGLIGEESIIVRLASQLRSIVPEFQLKGNSWFRTTPRTPLTEKLEGLFW